MALVLGAEAGDLFVFPRVAGGELAQLLIAELEVVTQTFQLLEDIYLHPADLS